MKSVSRWFHYNDILWCTVNKTLSLALVYCCGLKWAEIDFLWRIKLPGLEIRLNIVSDFGCYVTQLHFIKRKEEN
jgi:hypothetical protein